MAEPGENFRRMLASQAQMSLRDQIATVILSRVAKDVSTGACKMLSEKECKLAAEAAYRLADSAVDARTKTKDRS